MKKAIVIGATSGIGRAAAELLSAKGYAVGITGRRMERLEELRQSLKGPVFLRKMDVAEPEQAAAGLEELAAEMGGADVILICSGIVQPNGELDWKKEKETIATDVTGFAAVAGAAVRLFLRQGHGQLVGLSSLSALVYSDRTGAYCASKAFVSHYLRGLRILLNRAQGDYCVTEVLPGWVRTEMTKNADPSKVFWAATAEQAAWLIYGAIAGKKRKIYILRRWRPIAWLIRLLPERFRIK